MFVLLAPFGFGSVDYHVSGQLVPSIAVGDFGCGDTRLCILPN
jgi:hypothetical protein